MVHSYRSSLNVFLHLFQEFLLKLARIYIHVYEAAHMRSLTRYTLKSYTYCSVLPDHKLSSQMYKQYNVIPFP